MLFKLVSDNENLETVLYQIQLLIITSWISCTTTTFYLLFNIINAFTKQ